MTSRARRGECRRADAPRSHDAPPRLPRSSRPRKNPSVETDETRRPSTKRSMKKRSSFRTPRPLPRRARTSSPRPRSAARDHGSMRALDHVLR
eukprot:29281-Pelagococcus_subviridis.AAC.19